MSRTDNLPVIFLAFANEQGQTRKYLRDLPEEARRLRQTLEEAEEAGRCRLILRPNATLDEILDIFQDGRYRNRISIFHYGGHADGYGLLLEVAGRQSALADAGGLATFLAQQESLRLVFLNGCSTAEQVAGLLQAGVKAVVATGEAIRDDVARTFADRFYRGLAGGASLRAAYWEAEGALQAQHGRGNLRGLYWAEAEAEARWPWELYEVEATAADWTLPEPLPQAEGPVTVIGRDQIVHNITYIEQKALSAVEEAEKAEVVAQQRLAEGVRAYALRLIDIAADEADADRGGPYKGLLSYTLSDAELFFGREEAIARLLRRVQRGRLLALHSESGAGKSSLLQAGLAPRLILEGHLPLYLRPYGDPPARRIKGALVPEVARLPELADLSLPAFLHRITAILPATTTLFIFLDQFEEFFTLLPEPDRAEFVAELAECLEDETLNVRWLLALRSDYFSNLANFRPRIRQPFENDYRLNRLSRAEAGEVIVAPAARQGIDFEPGLVETLLDDLEREGISPPQIQLVCLALYESLEQGQTTITQARYRQLGQAAGILQSHLERVLARDLSDQRLPALGVLEALISSDGRRLIRTLNELAAELAPYGLEMELLRDILDRLVDSRLVRAVEDGQRAEPAYELTHDYLVRQLELSPEVKARKAAAELLERELLSWREFKALMRPQTLRVVGAQREQLHLNQEARQLLLASAFETGAELPQWLAAAPPAEARQALLAGLARTDPALRLRAVRHLSPFFDEAVAAALEPLLFTAEPAELRQAALALLGQHAPDRTRQLLLENLAQPQPQQRAEVIEALRAYPDAEVAGRLFERVGQDEAEPVWQAALATLAAPEMAGYRQGWRPLIGLEFRRAAAVSAWFSGQGIPLPWPVRLRLLPAHLARYLWGELRHRPLWLAARLAIPLLLYLALAWGLSWWPFIRWEAIPGVPAQDMASLDLLPGEERMMILSSYDYGLARQTADGAWRAWLTSGLPTGEPADEAEPASNIRAIIALAIDPKQPEEVYGYAIDTGLYRSDNRGESWQAIGTDQVPVSRLTPDVDAFEGQILLISGANLYASRDRGENWQQLDGQDELPDLQFLKARFSPEGRPYVAGADGLYVGQDLFPWEWQRVTDQPVHYIDFSPNGDILYLALGWPLPNRVACYGSGYDLTPEELASANRSPVSLRQIWGSAGARFKDNFVTALAAHPNRSGLFYASAFGSQTYALTCDERWHGLGGVPGGQIVTDLKVWSDPEGDWLIQTNWAGAYRRRL